MVVRNKKGKVVKVYLYGSEEQRSYEAVLEILFEADKKRLERLLNEKHENEQLIDDQIEGNHEKNFKKIRKRSKKNYNLTQTARILRVHRQTIYYWIKKKWVNPKRDYRHYPVFTVLDIKRLIEWTSTLRVDDFQKTRK